MTSFDEVAARLWGGPSEDFPDRPLTDELVAEAERVLEVTLPADLLTLLRVRNGGVVAGAWNAHSLGADKYVLFDYLLGIALDPDMPSMLRPRLPHFHHRPPAAGRVRGIEPLSRLIRSPWTEADGMCRFYL